MSFWEQYVALWRHIWQHHRWTLLLILGLAALIDLIRWHHGLPYFPFG